MSVSVASNNQTISCEALSTKAMFLLAFSVYIVVVLMQWAHFAGYYGQPKGLSLIWSVVDWAVWTLVFAGFVLITNRYRSIPWYMSSALFIALAGPVQLQIANMVYAAVLGSDETLWQAFTHMMDKRWLSNLYVAGLLVAVKHLLMIKWFEKPVTNEHSTETQVFKSNPSIVKLDNGEASVNINLEAVSHIITCRNYVSLFLDGEEVVLRNTLKNIRSHFSAEHFVQVSRSSIVNTHFIEKAEKYSTTSFRLITVQGFVINVGRTYRERPEVKTLLNTRPRKATPVPGHLPRAS